MSGRPLTLQLFALSAVSGEPLNLVLPCLSGQPLPHVCRRNFTMFGQPRERQCFASTRSSCLQPPQLLRRMETARCTSRDPLERVMAGKKDDQPRSERVAVMDTASSMCVYLVWATDIEYKAVSRSLVRMSAIESHMWRITAIESSAANRNVNSEFMSTTVSIESDNLMSTTTLC